MERVITNRTHVLSFQQHLFSRCPILQKKFFLFGSNKKQMEHIFKTFFWITLIDSIYLGVLKRNHLMSYFTKINCGQKPQLKLWAGIIVWLLLAYSLEVYVYKGIKTKEAALLPAFIFGVITYAIYDFTNLASISNWTLGFSIQDILWGGLLMAIVTMIRRFKS
jgi:uncharacterized membrane protein